jgi:hypothetical protein
VEVQDLVPSPRELAAEPSLMRVSSVVVDDDPRRPGGPGHRRSRREPRKGDEQADGNVQVRLDELVLHESDHPPGPDGGGAGDPELPVRPQRDARGADRADDEHEERAERDRASGREQLQVDVVGLVHDTEAQAEDGRMVEVGSCLEEQVVPLVIAARRRLAASGVQQHVWDPGGGQQDGRSEHPDGVAPQRRRSAGNSDQPDRAGEEPAAGAGGVDPAEQQRERERTRDPPPRRSQQPQRRERDRDRAHDGDVVGTNRQAGLPSHGGNAERVIADVRESQLVARRHGSAREP